MTIHTSILKYRHEHIPNFITLMLWSYLCLFWTVPFDEDDKDDSVWFLDHDYLENMYGMFKKVNGRSIFKFRNYLVFRWALLIYFKFVYVLPISYILHMFLCISV